jgi:enoyl-CoA hydratase/carnithine racemase
MSSYETIKYSVRDRIAYLELNRPDALNTITNDMVDEVKAALLEYDLDDQAWVLIFHGAGRCFTAGVDLRSFTAFNVDKSDSERKAAELDSLRKGHNTGAMHLRGTGGEGLLGRTIRSHSRLRARGRCALGGRV